MTSHSPEQAAEQYADSKIPNPSKHNAPFYTTQDRWDDTVEAFIAGSKWEWYKPTNHPERFRNLDVSIDVVAELHTGIMVIASYHFGINKWLNGMEEIQIKHWCNLPTPPEPKAIK